MHELLGLEGWWNSAALTKLSLRLAINLLFAGVTTRYMYLRFRGRSEFAFSCIMLNVITFSICLLLRKVSVELGFALGLFGVFGILRYRTDPINTRDLSYLFVAIALGMLNAMANKKISLAELLFINITIMAVAAWLEYAPLSGRRETHELVYDDLDKLHPERRQDLIQDLKTRTGWDVIDVRVGDMDLVKDSGRITVFCHETKARAS